MTLTPTSRANPSFSNPMTKYLNSQPFSAPVSNGKMTDLEYKIAVGGLIFCWACAANVENPHTCPSVTECDCEACQ